MLQAKKSFYQSISRLYDKTIDNRSLPKSIKKQKFIYRNLQKLYLADTTINNFFQVCFIFSCFEKQDLKLAFNLFQKYLASLTNYLKTYNDLKTVHEKDKTNLRAAWTQTRLQNQQLPNSKLNFKQSVAYLKLVGSLNENLNSTEVSMPTKLYTVIRSPHVFKKTREQFAITKYKRVVKLVFKSKSALKILVDSFVLLKLPAEVKIIIRNK
uniref:ribosomal protein S10 n=1 Tax=Gayralia brasiliensis TaxID=1286870 RepID=UPI0024111EAC|nr:ribosomal protein S10 [Gayralia brasiliensis]YP_010733818.1 ribosomal protein S10 [Monostroma nitidum]WEG93060.1 ribosomal protein S10 [Gayralia brasiliensis]WEG93089.1 ribosomal protein S10 [Monostroma nitidum]